MIGKLKQNIEEAWENRDLLSSVKHTTSIRQVIELLDKGEVRVAQPDKNGWKVNEWIKKAVVLRKKLLLFLILLVSLDMVSLNLVSLNLILLASLSFLKNLLSLFFLVYLFLLNY